MALATRDDVARVLRLSAISEDQEANVDEALAVAESWVKRYLRSPDLGSTGTPTVVKSDVPVDGYIDVPGTPTSVSVVYYAGATPQPLSPSSWTYDGTGVRLRFNAGFERWYDPRFATEAFRTAFVEVRVTCSVGDDVDPVIRDATALAAAALWTRGPRAGKGLQSENIGDYGYTLMQIEGGDVFFGQARAMLKSLRPDSGISVV